MEKRAMAFILCLSIIVTMFIPVAPVKALEDSAFVMYEGEVIENIYITETEKRTVSAVFDGEALSYQWQILVSSENDVWANIYDKTTEECEISYALVNNMLERTGEAYIRCKITYAEGEAFTNGVSVSVYEDELAENEPEMVEPTILVSDMQVVEPEEETTEEEQEESSEEELPVEGEVSEEESSEEEIIEEEPAEDVSEEEFSEESAAEEEILEEAVVFEASYEEEIELLGAEPGTETEPEKEYVTITIYYLDAASLIEGREESAVYTPYVATIEKGSAFSQNVISPTYLGFAPYLSTDDNKITVTLDGENYVYSGGEDASTVVLDYAEGALIKDEEIKVYYKPIEVPYGVRYFFQNINDDSYTEEAILYHTHTAVTGTIINDSQFKAGVVKDGKDYSVGFTQMYHIPEAVASDGSTVFEVYYDRNYYLIEFDFNGGYGSDPIYARYGTPFVVNDPVRHGYVFDGWDLIDPETGIGDGNEDEMPKTIQEKDQKYEAIWKAVNTTYTVVYWKENADDDGYSYWDYREKGGLSGTTVNGEDTASADGLTDAAYFTFNPARSDKNVLVEGDGSTVVNVYYTRNYYSITFKANGLCVIEENHIHTDECYGYVCGAGNHIHTNECIVCEETEHTHSDICCNITEHTHSADCCTKTVHTHDETCCSLTEHEHTKECCSLDECTHPTTACWKNVGDKYNGWPNRAPTNPQQGQVYRRNGNSTKYIYLNGSWYEYSGTESSGAEVTANNCQGHTHGDDCNILNCSNGGAEHIHGSGCNILNCSNGGAEHTHSDGNCTYCTQTEHSHGGVSCNCTIPEHEHIDSCYDCNLTEHTHTDDCLRSEPVCEIPEGHEHDGYYCNSSTRSSTVKIVRRKYQQPLDDIWPVTDDNGKTYDDGQRWDPSNSSYYSEVLVYLDEMVPDDFTLTVDISSASYFTMNYYLQVLPGDEYDVKYGNNYYALYVSNKARYNHITKAEDFFDIKGFVQYASDPSFGSGTSINPSDKIADFYYNRITDHYLRFSNNGELLNDNEVHGIMYGASLTSYNFTPPYPNKLEPNAYYFAGWYTSPGCFDGTEVNWDTLTMPEGDLLLYAKWSPNVHTVQFFHDLEDLEKYEKFMEENKDNPSPGEPPTKPIEGQVYNIDHGNTVGSVPNPERDTEDEEELAFGGWFYLENGEKKAFTPTDFPIKRDMNIFADWAGETPVPYKISYVERGTGTKVADDYTGFAKVGSTKTFNAKAGYPYNQLYPEFNGSADSEGYFYFPVNASHSITMEYDDEKIAANAKVNKYTFEYVKAGIPINYKVRYVDKETGEVLGEELKNTKKAVVTERFKAFPNYVPDAFYKRLVISVKVEGDVVSGNDEENIVIFYYSKNSSSAYYAVHYMLEKLDATDETRQQYKIDGTGGYEETGTHIEGIGDIDSFVKIPPQKFTGFTLLEDKAKEVISTPKTDSSGYDATEYPADYSNGEYSIKITQNGTELYIFYSRNEYPYDVYHYKYNSTEPVDPDNPKDERQFAKYGSEVTAEARDIPSWTCVNGEVYVNPDTNEIILVDPNTGKTIDGEEIPSDAIKKNILTKDIHEEPKDTNGEYPYTLKYNNIIFYYVQTEYVIEYVAVPPEGGTLSLSLETVKGNDTPVGSTPAANENYEFKGWYLDEACTKPVTDEYGTVDENNKLVPKTTLLHPNKADDRRNIFYAKFDPLAGDFTIQRNLATDEPGDEKEQVFVYEVRCTDEGKDDFVITVTITGNGTVTIHDLPLGTYTVTQKNNWSWRYTDDKPQTEVQHNSATGIAVEFNKEEANVYWLNGNSKKEINEKA